MSNSRVEVAVEDDDSPCVKLRLDGSLVELFPVLNMTIDPVCRRLICRSPGDGLGLAFSVAMSEDDRFGSNLPPP